MEKQKGEGAIQEILSSLQDRLQRWTFPTEAGDAPESERELALQTYEAALRVVHQKVVETATALQSDLDRLNNELRGRPWVHCQSGSQHRTWSRKPMKNTIGGLMQSPTIR